MPLFLSGFVVINVISTVRCQQFSGVASDCLAAHLPTNQGAFEGNMVGWQQL